MNFPPRESYNNTPPQAASDGRVAVKLPAKKPTVTYVIIGITVLMYGLQFLSTSLSSNGIDCHLSSAARSTS